MALLVTTNVGRLVELRVEAPIRVDEAKPSILEIMRVTNLVAGRCC